MHRLSLESLDTENTYFQDEKHSDGIEPDKLLESSTNKLSHSSSCNSSSQLSPSFLEPFRFERRQICSKNGDGFSANSSNSFLSLLNHNQQPTSRQHHDVDETMEFPAIVPLNVGGVFYMTRLSTLRKYSNSMLDIMFSGRHKLDRDKAGYYFLDTNGTFFGYILDFLRHETLPPNEVAQQVYREACYFGLQALQEALIITPTVASIIVKEQHRSQFPEYTTFRQKCIETAMKNAVNNKVGDVIIFAHRSENKNSHNACVIDSAHVSIGPWQAPVDEEVFIRTLQSDFQEAGFNVAPFERKKCKWYVQGQSCSRVVYKLSITFS